MKAKYIKKEVVEYTCPVCGYLNVQELWDDNEKESNCDLCGEDIELED